MLSILRHLVLSQYSRCLLEILLIYILAGFLSQVFRFFAFEKKFFYLFENKHSSLFSFFYFQNSENLRYQFDSHVHSQPSVKNKLALSLKLFAWQRFPYTLIFNNNLENMTSCRGQLRSTYQGYRVFLSFAKLLTGRVLKFRDDLYLISEDIGEK